MFLWCWVFTLYLTRCKHSIVCRDAFHTYTHGSFAIINFVLISLTDATPESDGRLHIVRQAHFSIERILFADHNRCCCCSPNLAVHWILLGFQNVLYLHFISIIWHRYLRVCTGCAFNEYSNLISTIKCTTFEWFYLLSWFIRNEWYLHEFPFEIRVFFIVFLCVVVVVVNLLTWFHIPNTIIFNYHIDLVSAVAM